MSRDFSFLSTTIVTKRVEKDTFLDVIDRDRILKLPLRSGETEHYFGNLLVESGEPTFKSDIDFKVESKQISSDPFLHQEQIGRNLGLQSEKGVYFRVVKRGIPSKAVITFPQSRGFGGWKAPYSIFNGEKLEIDNTLYISFQDPYFVMGSYFLSDNEGTSPIPRVVNVIRRELVKHNLGSENSTFIGASKGSTIAALVSQYFESNQLLLFAYATNLEYRIRESWLNHLALTLDYFKISIPDTLEVLRSEANRKETHWVFSIGDDIVNFGNEHLKARFLTSYASDVPHGLLLKQNWNFVKALIEDFHGRSAA